jgi:hypothetical protein
MQHSNLLSLYLISLLLAGQEYFWWEYDSCMNSGAAPGSNSVPAPAPTPTAPTPAAPSPTGPSPTLDAHALWYPDWLGEDQGCKADGQQPDYMTRSPDLWMHSTISACCTTNYNWMLSACLENSSQSQVSYPAPAPSSPVVGLFYPDWEGSNEGCLADGNEPAYMKANPGLWMYNSLSECCDANYEWSLSTCDPSRTLTLSAPSSIISESSPWCMSYSDNKCVQVCPSWETSYSNQSECCSQR